MRLHPLERQFVPPGSLYLCIEVEQVVAVIRENFRVVGGCGSMNAIPR